MTTTDDLYWYARIGVALREQRKARGWTLYDVAEVCDTSANSVSLWERGLRRMKARQYVLLQQEGLL